MANTGQSDRRKAIRREGSRRKGDLRAIKIQGKEEREKEVSVLHEAVRQAKEKSTWSWHEEFVVDWSESLITKKGKKRPRKGE
jgi:hypothetical protein